MPAKRKTQAGTTLSLSPRLRVEQHNFTLTCEHRHLRQVVHAVNSDAKPSRLVARAGLFKGVADLLDGLEVRVGEDSIIVREQARAARGGA